MAINKLFGTDGIRGNINASPLLPENIALIGRILGLLVQHSPDFKACKKLILIGRDTRSSGLYLEQALIAGITSMGVDCELVSVMPTAAVAAAAMRSEASFGLIISASHNPFHDNGLKIFGHDGLKIGASLERTIEELYYAGGPQEVAFSIGSVITNSNAEATHRALLQAIFTSRLDHMRLAIDCAHGAAAFMAPKIFAERGAQLALLGVKPDGSNINRGFGSEAPQQIRAQVLDFFAHLGIAFDGDADRVIFVDEKGQLIDGDAVLATMAIDLHKKGKLAKNTLVATIMSSVALDRAVAPYGICVERTSVGDKYVAEAMAKSGYTFGGENSGHILMFPEATTGDGILSALMFLQILAESNKSASELVSFFEPCPKLLKNISVSQKMPLSLLPKTKAAIDRVNKELQDQGRVLLRYSGTENKARLLVEAASELECARIAEAIAAEFSDEVAKNGPSQGN